MKLFNLLCVIATYFAGVSSFSRSISPLRSPINIKRANGVRSMTAILDVLAGLSIASSSINPSYSSQASSSLTISVETTKQGLYREYTVDENDKKVLDDFRSTYKTAEETDENKTKYWALFGVLLAGSFVIPMVQYYWYVAEED